MLASTTDASFFQKLIFSDYAASRAGAWTDGLFMTIFWFSVICFVVLMGLMVYFVIKYRRRPGVPAQPSPNHNLYLEILWTVVPSSSLLVFFVLGVQGYTMTLVPPQSAMELKIDAWKWAWKVTYPNGATSPETKFLAYNDNMDALEAGQTDTLITTTGLQYPIFYVPEDTAIKLRMNSLDVIHSFWIPEFRAKMDVIPNRYTGFGFHTPKLTSTDVVEDAATGTNIQGRDMWIFCAEYCGDEHSRMAATLRVVTKEVYKAKIKEWGTEKDPLVLGQSLYQTMCAICHTVDGTPSTGPTWSSGNGYGFGYEAPLTDGSNVMRDANYLRESILDPNAKIVDGYIPSMPSFQAQLNETDIEALIMYMQSLSDRNPNASESDSENEQAENTAGSDG